MNLFLSRQRILCALSMFSVGSILTVAYLDDGECVKKATLDVTSFKCSLSATRSTPLQQIREHINCILFAVVHTDIVDENKLKKYWSKVQYWTRQLVSAPDAILVPTSISITNL